MDAKKKEQGYTVTDRTPKGYGPDESVDEAHPEDQAKWNVRDKQQKSDAKHYGMMFPSKKKGKAGFKLGDRTGKKNNGSGSRGDGGHGDDDTPGDASGGGGIGVG